MIPAAGSLRRGFKAFLALLKDPRFWAVQASVVAVALAHDLLERFVSVPSDLIDFLPVAFFWIPLLYGALRFGLAGSIATSVVLLVSSLPNWLYLQRSSTLPLEAFLVIITVAVTIFVGRQSDRKLEAQRSARAYAAYAVKTQEEERRRLSLDLHDDPVQTLVSVCYELDSLKDLGPQAAIVAEARNSVAEVVQRLRDIGASLHPPALDDIGVVSVVRGMLADFSSKGAFAGAFDVKGEARRLPSETELAIFRIAQEALRNASRHAAAAHLCVRLAFSSREVSLEVADDGVGFDVSSPDAMAIGHLGLLGMRERAEMVGGKLAISSKPGHGTQVTACLPIDPPQSAGPLVS